jgi:hypothetical protein
LEIEKLTPSTARRNIRARENMDWEIGKYFFRS